MGKIMLVDDTAFVRLGLRNILTENGYEIVAEASNGKEALNYYLQRKPDLVTLDIMMPDMDGITALKEIKKINKDAKVIICSTLGQKEMIVEALKAGAVDYIIKPYQKERVIESVKKVIGIVSQSNP